MLKYYTDSQSPFPTIVPCFPLGGKSILYINYALVLGIEFGTQSPIAFAIIVTMTPFYTVVIFLTIWIGVKQCMRGSVLIYYVILTMERTGRREINPLTTVLYRDGEQCGILQLIGADVGLAIAFSSILFGQYSICIENDKKTTITYERFQSLPLPMLLFLQELHR